MATRQTSGTRAKDSALNDTCQILDSALSEGQLSMEEHRQRVSSATNAATLGELQTLVADLQTSNAPVRLPTLKKPQRVGHAAAVAGVLVVFGVAIGLGSLRQRQFTVELHLRPRRQGRRRRVVLTPPRQLHSVGGLTGLIEQMKKKLGDTMGFQLVVYPDYASLTRPDPTEERRELNYSYRGGWGDPTSGSKSADATLVDLSKFDVKAVVGVLRGAPETLGIKPADVSSTYLILDPSGDPTTPGALALSVYVSSDYGSGYIELDGAGNAKQINYPS